MTTDLPAFRVQTRIAHDADEQARNLHGWRQTYDQLTSGRFVGELTGVHFDDMHVFRESTSQTLRQTCEVQSDAYWFGIPVRGGATGRVDANIICADALAIRPGGVEFELLTPGGYEIFGVVVSGDVLRRHAAVVEHSAWVDCASKSGVMPIDAVRKACLYALLTQILASGSSGSSGISGSVASLNPHARESLQSSVLAALFDVGAPAIAEPVAIPLRSRRQRIVSEARDYVLAHRDRPVSVPELCEHLHVSRRTLQYSFEDALGIAPAHYLRAIRLNGARRDLCDAHSVQEVAAAWGFWHLSQFATDYRKLFGLRPSETLKAAQAAVAEAPFAH